MPMDGMDGMMVWGWLGALLGLLILLLIAAVLALGLVHLIRALRHPGTSQRGDAPADSSGQRALQLLDERYARGEIDHDDYEQRRRALQG